MARRHPQKGCHCTTCTNERAYNRANADKMNAYHRARYHGMTEAQIAHRRSLERARRRRQEDADHWSADAARLDDLFRRTVL